VRKYDEPTQPHIVPEPSGPDRATMLRVISDEGIGIDEPHYLSDAQVAQLHDLVSDWRNKRHLAARAATRSGLDGARSYSERQARVKKFSENCARHGVRPMSETRRRQLLGGSPFGKAVLDRSRSPFDPT
jgi:hypothetical protein